MESSTLIRKIYMACPICGRTHEVEERKRRTSIAIKGDRVSYEEKFYFCVNANEDENEFATGSMENENLLNARNAYRALHGLLTSDEIIALRESYGLSQVDFARLLGWGEATIARYETKAIQDEAYDIMLRLIKDNPLKSLEFLKHNAANFSEKKRQAIKAKIVEKLNSYGREYLTRQAFQGEYANYEEPSAVNGYTILNIAKTEAAISYIAEQVQNLYKVKLMKMLWYADALSYKTRGCTITGMVYRHDAMGALPIGHRSLMNLHNLNVDEEENSYHGTTMMHIAPTAGMDYNVLGIEDKNILDTVIRKFVSYTTNDIVEYMHQEKAYRETKYGEIIPFSMAMGLKNF